MQLIAINTIEMKKTAFIIIVLLCFGCHNANRDTHASQTQTHEHENDTDSHAKHNDVNEHMHQSSVNDLIEQFESPERDAYQKPEEVLDYLGDITNKTIIDIGAGSGYFSVKLAKKGANVIAADVNDEFLKSLQDRVEENNLQNIEVRKIPYDSPNLKNEEVDIVFIVNTYHHIENRSAYFEEVKKGTKDHRVLILIDCFKTDIPVGPPVNHKLAMDDVITELKKAGYTSFDIDVELLPYQYIIKAK